MKPILEGQKPLVMLRMAVTFSAWENGDGGKICLETLSGDSRTVGIARPVRLYYGQRVIAWEFMGRNYADPNEILEHVASQIEFMALERLPVPAPPEFSDGE